MCDGADRPHTGNERVKESLWTPVNHASLHLQSMSRIERGVRRRKTSPIESGPAKRIELCCFLDEEILVLAKNLRLHATWMSHLVDGMTRPRKMDKEGLAACTQARRPNNVSLDYPDF